MTINESDFKAAGCSDWNKLCDTPETEGKTTTLENTCPEPISGATGLSPPATSLSASSVGTTDKNPGEVSSSEDQGLLETSPSDVPSSSNPSATTLQWMEAKNPNIHREIRSMMINCGFGIWKCAVCDYAPAKSSNLYNHIECKHLPDHPGYDCDICSRVCKTRHGLICHTQKAHRRGKNPPVTKQNGFFGWRLAQHERPNLLSAGTTLLVFILLGEAYRRSSPWSGAGERNQ